MAAPMTLDLLEIAQVTKKFGKCVQIGSLLVHVAGVDARIGELCELVGPGDLRRLGEVLALKDECLVLCPYEGVEGLSSQTRVYPLGRSQTIPVGTQMLGRVLDSLGNPMDGLGGFPVEAWVSTENSPPDPMERAPIEHFMPTGIRAMDGLLPFAVGQRIGIFAPAGGGKSTLLGMLTRGCQADIVVIALIGERGREVKEYVDDVLGPEGLARSVLFVATADRHSIERARCAFSATAAAEYFRDQGMSVLLLVDSVTRFGRAQREIGLAVGEPPTRRGYPPSLFARLPKLFERAGNAKIGSISAIYTVLMEDEDTADPLAEEVRSLLDGHIVLSRTLGENGHYPAIAVDESLSRLANRLMTKAHAQSAKVFRKMMAKQKEMDMVIKLGEYVEGNDPEADRAIQSKPTMLQFLQQSTDEAGPWDEMLEYLESITRE